VGFLNIVRGVICLVRAQSEDDYCAKSIEDKMDKYESKQTAFLGNKVGASGPMHNLLVLLVGFFLLLAVVGAVAVGYSFWSRP